MNEGNLLDLLQSIMVEARPLTITGRGRRLIALLENLEQGLSDELATKYEQIGVDVDALSLVNLNTDTGKIRPLSTLQLIQGLLPLHRDHYCDVPCACSGTCVNPWFTKEESAILEVQGLRYLAVIR